MATEPPDTTAEIVARTEPNVAFLEDRASGKFGMAAPGPDRTTANGGEMYCAQAALHYRREIAGLRVERDLLVQQMNSIESRIDGLLALTRAALQPKDTDHG